MTVSIAEQRDAHTNELPRGTRQLAPAVVYLIACFFALLAGNMFNYSMIVYSGYISEKNVFVGMVNLATYVVPLLLGLRAASILDSTSRKRILLGFQFLWAMTALTLSIAIFFSAHGKVAPPLLIGISMVNGVAFTFLLPARFAFIADVSPRRILGRMTILANVLLIVSFGLAPILAGQIRDRFEWHVLFGVVVVLLLVSEAVLTFVPETRDSKATAEAPPSFASGWQYLKENPLLAQLLSATVVTFCALGPIQVLVPRLATSEFHLDEGGRGQLMGLLGLGLLVGGILALIAAKLARRGPLLLITQLVTGAALLGLSASQTASMGGTTLVIAGLFGGMGGSLIPAALQTHVEPEFRGRVMGYYSLISLLTPAVSGALVAVASDAVGISGAFRGCGIAIIVAGLLSGSWFGSLRQYR